jgi:alcohol dehydrogenase class IV
LGDAQALRGLELLAKGLAAVKAQPNDSTARLDCLLGAWLSMGPLVSGVPMGASHGIGYVLCAQFGILHGHTSCLMLPSVMAWNASVNGDRQRLVSTAFGDARKDASVLLGELISGLGVPRGLLANGITADDFDEIARTAMLTPWLPENPRQINGPDEVQEILALAQ